MIVIDRFFSWVRQRKEAKRSKAAHSAGRLGCTSNKGIDDNDHKSRHKEETLPTPTPRIASNLTETPEELDIPSTHDKGKVLVNARPQMELIQGVYKPAQTKRDYPANIHALRTFDNYPRNVTTEEAHPTYLSVLGGGLSLTEFFEGGPLGGTYVSRRRD